jgi:hypothetical protein
MTLPEDSTLQKRGGIVPFSSASTPRKPPSLLKTLVLEGVAKLDEDPASNTTNDDWSLSNHLIVRASYNMAVGKMISADKTWG